MKKQLLILVLMLAFFASSPQLFAQNPSDPPDCAGSENTPSIGVEYTYQVTVVPYEPNTGEGFNADGYYDWFVVVDPDADPTTPFDLLTQPSVALAANEFTVNSGVGFATYNDATNTYNPIRITWNSAATTTDPYYLVIRYRETYAGGPTSCEPNNVKVYLITPQNTFWLKIENVADATGTAGGDQICAPVVASAIVGADGEIDYDYGITTHYLKITANGYTGDWTPRLRMTDLPNDMLFSSVTWTGGAASGTFTDADDDNIWISDNLMPSVNTWDQATTSWGDGQVIYVTIVLDHNAKETIADLPLLFELDGTFLAGGVTYNDMYNAGAPNTCVEQPAWLDAASRVLRARPTVNPNTPATFIPANTIP